MKEIRWKHFAWSVCLAMAIAAPAASQSAQPADNVPNLGANHDNPWHPLGAREARMRKRALNEKLHGKWKGGRRHQVSGGKYVELERAGEDSIFTIIGDFGTQISSTYGGGVGPQKNEIPQPDRQFDNSTIWAPDFSKDYYEKLLFSEKPNAISMRNFYIEQSSNRYTVNGAVTDWVQVPFNEAYYGSNYCGGIVCARTWLFVQDAANAWYNSRLAAGMSPDDINAYLSQFDKWDRYDYDGDGNFNEPDGYIDHYQTIHAGEGEETGGGAQGENAIWSHRWYAFYNNIGSTGPAFNLFGGVRIGQSDYWIGDYTVEPENGGVGVFSHEFGHDLGLPDLYDTSGNTGGAENSTGFWTLYSSGSYGNSGKAKDGLGTKPVHMSAYEKIFLGWSNYATVDVGQRKTVKLGPAETNTTAAQQLVVLLPDKDVTTVIGPPNAGTYFYFSGAGNNLDNKMSRTVTLPAGSVMLSASVRYDIEMDWDYAYLTVNGTAVQTNRSSATNPNGQNFGQGITGSTDDAWVSLTANLSAYAGQTVALGFRYWSDGAVAGDGFSVDDIAITGLPTDGAETDPGWTYAGFSRSNGSVTLTSFNAYFGEFRQYAGFDKSLKTGPYTFAYLNNPDYQNFVDHYPYQDGLLMWYYDTSFPDNNVGDHCLDGRCGGLFLPIDAHPDLMIRPDNGRVWRPAIQSYDSTFGLWRTDVVCIHANSVPQCFGDLPANPKFDDTESYWVPPNAAIGNFGWASVPLPGYGVTVRVLGVSVHRDFMDVQVSTKSPE